jgi:hypothetical protein
MKKIITAFSITTLLCVSSAFAAEQSTGNTKLSKQQESGIVAFQNVESSALTANEMKIAGEGIVFPRLPIKPSPIFCRTFPWVCKPYVPPRGLHF